MSAGIPDSQQDNVRKINLINSASSEEDSDPGTGLHLSDQALSLCSPPLTVSTSSHLQSLFSSHDIVASREFQPKLDNVPFEVDEDEETVKIVQLVKSQDTVAGAKNAEPIVGATIKAEDATGRILIARVMHGGAADRSGLISVGDEVIEVSQP